MSRRETECVAGAILVHGLGAHSGWFEALGRRLRIRRIYSIAYDQVGFGKRKDEDFISYNQWLEDLETAFGQSPFVATADDRIIPPRRKFGCDKMA